MTRLLVLLLVAAPLAAHAQVGSSDLDRLGGTDGVLGPAASADAPLPSVGRVCNGVETGSTAPCPPPDAPPVPVDGGLGLLALAGAGYAARRLRRR